MIIVIGATITKNEDENIFLKNVKLLKENSLFSKVVTVINSNNHNIIESINMVGDIVESRKSLSREMSKYNADAFILLDADISIDNTDINKAMNYKNKYDVISMYYTGDSPLPILLTISGSLNDIMYGKKTLEDVPFNDDEMNSSNYLMVGDPGNLSINNLFLGKITRNILPKIKGDNSSDFTSGGASIYFDKNALIKYFEWPKYNGKSYKWYDSYKMMKISKEFKYAKVPVFVKHIRSKKSEVKLDWDEFERYFLGFVKLYPKTSQAIKLKKVLLRKRIEYLMKINNIRSKEWK